MGALFLEQFLKEKKISFAEDYEFTLEVNPGGWDEESLAEWRRMGVNRFSLGIQSYDSHMIKLLDRVHSLEDVKDLLSFFKKIGVNYSVDFMLGLPSSEEHKRDVLKELDQVLAYNPSHISLYILTVKSNYVHHTKLPSEEWIEKEYLSVSEYLKEKGYGHYEVSNFAKKGFESAHNLNYWKSKSVGALGPSATGLLSEAKIRYKWKTKSAEIEEEELTVEQMQLEYVYMALRSSVGLEINFFKDNVEAINLFSSWTKRDHAYIENERVFLTSAGFLILDSLMDDLFKIKAL